jgi:hypothetical protein
LLSHWSLVNMSFGMTDDLMTNDYSAEVAQLVERWLPKPKVAGSSPVFRSKEGARGKKQGAVSMVKWLYGFIVFNCVKR